MSLPGRSLMKGLLDEEAGRPGSAPVSGYTPLAHSRLRTRDSTSYTRGLDTRCDKVTHAQQSVEQQPSRLPAALCGDGSTV